MLEAVFCQFLIITVFVAFCYNFLNKMTKQLRLGGFFFRQIRTLELAGLTDFLISSKKCFCLELKFKKIINL